nr:hypothetical protein [Tanacetum cinerariifolium]
AEDSEKEEVREVQSMDEDKAKKESVILVRSSKSSAAATAPFVDMKRFGKFSRWTRTKLKKKALSSSVPHNLQLLLLRHLLIDDEQMNSFESRSNHLDEDSKYSYLNDDFLNCHELDFLLTPNQRPQKLKTLKSQVDDPDEKLDDTLGIIDEIKAKLKEEVKPNISMVEEAYPHAHLEYSTNHLGKKILILLILLLLICF